MRCVRLEAILIVTTFFLFFSAMTNMSLTSDAKAGTPSSETTDAIEYKSVWQYRFPLIPEGVTPLEDYQVVAQHDQRTITSQKENYTLRMNGTVDGPSMRSPMSYTAWTQLFQPMKFVRLENIGQTDIINPRLTVNNNRRWWSAQEIVKSALQAYGNPTSDADKVRAIYEYQIGHRFHGSTFSKEGDDAVKMFNVYGYTLCNNEGVIMMDLLRTAGYKVRYAYPADHVTLEVYYDDRWHLLDTDQHMYFLLPDNTTIAGSEDVGRDHDLIKRVHAYGISHPDAHEINEFSAAAYFYEGLRNGQYRTSLGHTMDMMLRPGEWIEWGFARKDLKHFAGHGLDPRRTQGETAGRLAYNGRWGYTPGLYDPKARRVHDQKNIKWSSTADGPAAVSAATGKPSTITWQIACPYVLVGGSVNAVMLFGQQDRTGLSISFDEGKTWQSVTSWKGEPGAMHADLTEYFPSVPATKGVSRHEVARYGYLLRLEMEASSTQSAVGLKSITIENDVQVAPLSLPELELGNNTISYSDQTQGQRQVRVTFDWVESSATQPPTLPQTPIFPQDGANVEGTQICFQWPAAVDPDGDDIADYQFQLSDRPDLLWVLSPNFNKLSTRTADEQPTKYTIPYEGLLNPDQTYYWRVRALDKHGLWGPWSKTWRFILQGPGVPAGITLTPGKDGLISLEWKTPGQGREPVAYEIYASNEKGFSISRKPYRVYVGNAKEGSLFSGQRFTQFPPNFLQSVQGLSLELRPTHVYYRVVAVDEQGHRSGPSDFVTAPQPFIHTLPVTEATVGQPYIYQARSLASIGDLRSNKGTQGFWNAQSPQYRLVKCPDWLRIDSDTGTLTGTASKAGVFDITIEAGIEGMTSKSRQSYQISVK